jgi:hypothetical protein
MREQTWGRDESPIFELEDDVLEALWREFCAGEGLEDGEDGLYDEDLEEFLRERERRLELTDW